MIPICICYLFEFKYINYDFFLIKKFIYVCRQGKKKKNFSPPICIQMSESYMYLLSI